MKTLVRIFTQYYENYGFYEGGEYWKKKGGQEFTLMADSDLFLYAEEDCVKAIKKLIKDRNNNHGRHEYISHELVFHNPIALDADHFEKELMIQRKG